MNRKFLRGALSLLLCAVLLLPLCACSESENDQSGAIIHEDIADYCYIGQEKGASTYACTVTDKNGFTLFHKEKMAQPPQTEAVEEHLLKVYYQAGNLAQGSWAVYCNVDTSQTSPVFNSVLATKGRYVVYTEFLTDAHQIFVRDAMDQALYFDFVTLSDADKGDAVLGGRLNEDGDLVVTYLCDKKEKTVVVALPKN